MDILMRFAWSLKSIRFLIYFDDKVSRAMITNAYCNYVPVSKCKSYCRGFCKTKGDPGRGRVKFSRRLWSRFAFHIGRRTTPGWKTSEKDANKEFFSRFAIVFSSPLFAYQRWLCIDFLNRVRRANELLCRRSRRVRSICLFVLCYLSIRTWFIRYFARWNGLVLFLNSLFSNFIFRVVFISVHLFRMHLPATHTHTLSKESFNCIFTYQILNHHDLIVNRILIVTVVISKQVRGEEADTEFPSARWWRIRHL